MTVSSGYENKGYDGDNPVKVWYIINTISTCKSEHSLNHFVILQPPLRNTEDTVSIREKVKLSPSEKWRILKNVAVLSSAFMIQFTAFQVIIVHMLYDCKITFKFECGKESVVANQ